MRANVVPQIAESIHRYPVNLKALVDWDYHWNEFSLADDLQTERETSSVELLIGNDYYLDIILPQKLEVLPGTLHAWFQTRLDTIRESFQNSGKHNRIEYAHIDTWQRNGQ